jgi:hypothetical protein
MSRLGRTVRNKAKRRQSVGGRQCYKQTQFLPLCQSGDRRSREGKSCETNPISESRAGRGPADEGRGSCTNKPNFGTPTCRQAGLGGTNKPNFRRTRIGGAGLPRQTNPISAHRPADSLGSAVQTNPISAEPDRWGRSIAPNKPNLRRSNGGQTCKTKPISRLRIVDFGLGTELRRDACHAASASGLRRTKCAKRTQFPATPGGTGLGDGGRGVLYKQTQFAPRRPYQSCETKPIPAGRPEYEGIGTRRRRPGHLVAESRISLVRKGLAR